MPWRRQRTLPASIILAGLQGSGKTTTAAKLALQLRREGKSALMVAADLQRPAAIDQLVSLGKQLGVPVYSEAPGADPVDVAKNGLKEARSEGVDWVIVDTAGRLNIDDELMKELSQIKKAVSPDDALLVVDSMTGQEAVNVAEEFNKRIGLTGLILTKMDGDARGGAALSVTSVDGGCRSSSWVSGRRRMRWNPITRTGSLPGSWAWGTYRPWSKRRSRAWTRHGRGRWSARCATPPSRWRTSWSRCTS